jgi:hypothetical protein
MTRTVAGIMSAPEPKPKLLLSATRRFRIRRTAQGWALYDHALGERHSVHRTMAQAVRQRRIEQQLLRQLRDQLNWHTAAA